MDIFSLLIWLLVLLIITALIYWVIGKLALPEPISRIAMIILVVVVAIILIMLLLQFAGVATPSFRR